VKGQPLPDYAREIGCENWAQFFLKYANPAITAAIPATTNPDHVAQNMGALRGSLPDKAMRARMVKHMKASPVLTNSPKPLGIPANSSLDWFACRIRAQSVETVTLLFFRNYLDFDLA
jgi:hypothetical protein